MSRLSYTSSFTDERRTRGETERKASTRICTYTDTSHCSRQYHSRTSPNGLACAVLLLVGKITSNSLQIMADSVFVERVSHTQTPTLQCQPMPAIWLCMCSPITGGGQEDQVTSNRLPKIRETEMIVEILALETIHSLGRTTPLCM
jgi:hypothetical protein